MKIAEWSFNFQQIWREERDSFCEHWVWSKMSMIDKLCSQRRITLLFPLSSASLVPVFGNSLCWAGRPSLKARWAPLSLRCLLLSSAGPVSWIAAVGGRGHRSQEAQGVAQSPWTAALCAWEPGASRGTSPCPTPWLRSPVFLKQI